jgi:hypothetical protein
LNGRLGLSSRIRSMPCLPGLSGYWQQTAERKATFGKLNAGPWASGLGHVVQSSVQCTEYSGVYVIRNVLRKHHLDTPCIPWLGSHRSTSATKRRQVAPPPRVCKCPLIMEYTTAVRITDGYREIRPLPPVPRRLMAKEVPPRLISANCRQCFYNVFTQPRSPRRLHYRQGV